MPTQPGCRHSRGIWAPVCSALLCAALLALLVLQHLPQETEVLSGTVHRRTGSTQLGGPSCGTPRGEHSAGLLAQLNANACSWITVVIPAAVARHSRSAADRRAVVGLTGLLLVLTPVLYLLCSMLDHEQSDYQI